MLLAHGHTRVCLQPQLCEGEKEKQRERSNCLSQVPLNNPLLLPLTVSFPLSVQLNTIYAKDRDRGWIYKDQETVPSLKELIV